ncbi:MAG TPA: gliding motility-associated C-terminal domain-containing protein, partial [Brumimicrobium sp.]|nr:gliding motility-associated C-terminal domain-containing protein [Brumimicrobium sp.]
GYYVLETINGACSSKDSVQITVNPTPIADANAANTTICEGEDIVLTATTIVGDYAWTGPNGFTSSAQNPTLTEVLPLTSGYYVLETILGTCSSKDSVEITVHPAPIADANVANAIICAGENIVLSATTVTADTYIWNGPNGFTSTTQNPTINAASVSASGYYVLETTLGSCSTKDSVEVTVAPAPIANANAVNTEICIGEDIALTATTIIGDYSWTGPNGFTSIDQNPTIANIGVNANGYYVLEVTSGGCSSKDSVEISINALPVLAITSTDINCNGNTNGSATVVATGNAPFTYSWMPNGQTSATINNLSEGNYSVTVEDGKGCINTATVQIEEPAVLDLTTTVTNSRCDIDNGIAKVIATGGSGTYSYLWMPSGQTTASVIGLAPGSYTVLVTDANGCDEVETVVVNTIDGPDLAINTIQNVTCSGANNGSAEAVVTNGTAPFSYNWSPIGGTNATANNLPEGKYVVTVTDGSGCSIKDSVEITINTTLTVVANATQTEICQDENIELSTSPIVGADYAWTGPNGFTSADQNPTLANTGTNASGYYVLEMTSGGCSAKDSVQITVNALPTLAITGTDINCNGNENGSATVVATGNGPFFYSWSPNGETTASINNLMAGTYTVTVDDAKGCSNTESIQISEPAMLNLTTSVTETRCDIDNGIATVSATGGSGVYTYLWMPSGQTTASIIGLSAGSYTVLVTDANGCDKVETVIVNSIDGPDLAITNAQNVSCFGGTDGSAEVTASNGTLPYTYSWSPIGGTNAIANNLPAGNYVVTVTDNSGCSTVESVTITEPDELDITSTIKPADCGEENGNISLAVTGGTSPYTFDWLTNTGTGASIQNISGGDYSVTVTDGAGCEISTTYTVPSNGALSIQVLPEEATILKGEEIALSVNVDPGIVNETYNWTPATGLSCTNCPNPIASPSVTTTYYVEVTTPDNCSGIDSTLIIVNDVCSDIYIPNIFSPNGDGKNDEYCIYGECISTFSLQIFNRWGELVYISDNEENCWDGTYKGKKLNTDVFVYKVSITTLQGEEIEESGNINLVR